MILGCHGRAQRRRWVWTACLLACLTDAALAQPAGPPHILGVAQISLYMHHCEQSRAYYGTFLGLEQVSPAADSCRAGSKLLFRVNRYQYVTLLPERTAGTDRLAWIALRTDDIQGYRRYLLSRGIHSSAVRQDEMGVLRFRFTDPEGHGIDIVQYPAGARILRAHGESMGEAPISHRMMHVGLIVTRLAREYTFYTRVLGFREFYRGSSNGSVLSWVNLRVPDGNDYIEFMLYAQQPDAERRGSAHHLCLEVANVHASVAELEKRPYFRGYKHRVECRVGVNHKWQSSFFDPDGTRTELMEPNTFDGKPAVSSTAPPPA